MCSGSFRPARLRHVARLVGYSGWSMLNAGGVYGRVKVDDQGGRNRGDPSPTGSDMARCKLGGILSWRSCCLAKYNVRVQSSQARPGRSRSRGGTERKRKAGVGNFLKTESETTSPTAVYTTCVCMYCMYTLQGCSWSGSHKVLSVEHLYLLTWRLRSTLSMHKISTARALRDQR